MSSIWNWYIIIIAAGNLLGCWWLIRWTAKPRPGEAPLGETTGHVWDGNLTEYNKPMPKWWLYLFYITIVFAFVYLILMPGFFSGVLGWSQVKAWEEDVAAAEARYGPIFAEYAKTPIPELAQNPEAMASGGRLYANNCSVCHGADARGARGFPNLADDAWQYGGSPEAIKASILNGRQGMMPPMAAAVGDEQAVQQVAAYVLSLSGRDAPADQAEAGQAKFQQVCAACHGQDGTGNTAIGAPNLTDDAWIYGPTMASIKQTINNGRQGQMPAWKERLGEDRSHVLAAYVYSLGNR